LCSRLKAKQNSKDESASYCSIDDNDNIENDGTIFKDTLLTTQVVACVDDEQKACV